MDTNEALRQQALRLVKHGVSQKVLGARMGMKESTFSRWLNGKPGVNPASVVALDGLAAFVKDLSTALEDGVHSTASGATFWDGKTERRAGEDRRVAVNDK